MGKLDGILKRLEEPAKYIKIVMFPEWPLSGWRDNVKQLEEVVRYLELRSIKVSSVNMNNKGEFELLLGVDFHDEEATAQLLNELNEAFERDNLDFMVY